MLVQYFNNKRSTYRVGRGSVVVNGSAVSQITASSAKFQRTNTDPKAGVAIIYGYDPSLGGKFRFFFNLDARHNIMIKVSLLIWSSSTMHPPLPVESSKNFLLPLKCQITLEPIPVGISPIDEAFDIVTVTFVTKDSSNTVVDRFHSAFKTTSI
jgi:hypothetical protein